MSMSMSMILLWGRVTACASSYRKPGHVPYGTCLTVWAERRGNGTEDGERPLLGGSVGGNGGEMGGGGIGRRRAGGWKPILVRLQSSVVHLQSSVFRLPSSIFLLQSFSYLTSLVNNDACSHNEREQSVREEKASVMLAGCWRGG